MPEWKDWYDYTSEEIQSLTAQQMLCLLDLEIYKQALRLAMSCERLLTHETSMYNFGQDRTTIHTLQLVFEEVRDRMNRWMKSTQLHELRNSSAETPADMTADDLLTYVRTTFETHLPQVNRLQTTLQSGIYGVLNNSHTSLIGTFQKATRWIHLIVEYIELWYQEQAEQEKD